MEAVVSASTGALQAVLPKLIELLTEEYKLHKGAKEGIRYIKSELVSMQVALEKASEVSDQQVKLWARELRDMSYVIEDTIDAYMVRVGEFSESDTTSCSCCSIDTRIYKARRDIATEIERIKKDVEDISRRRDRTRVDGVAVAASAPSDPRVLALYEDVAKLVGIDGPIQEIIKKLSMGGGGVSSAQKLKLVSIVGPGGMGKTTLANAVRQKLHEDFACTAFVSVSRKPNINKILSSILRQVTRKIKDVSKAKDTQSIRQESQRDYGNSETWSENEVIDKIKDVLMDKRYLIVIDDIWDESTWEHIKCVLIENNRGSKIITTTRIGNVAEFCISSHNADGIIHELRPLCKADSEKLFCRKVFHEDSCPPELNGVCQKILERCDGWPLAIVTVASLLANKQTQAEDDWYSVYNSIQTGLAGSRGVQSMREILSLSYYDMPSQLRACFLYLSMFPEDLIIGRDELIWRWVAENFVQGREDDNLYEAGDKYFNELINRSLIQPTQVDSFGRAQACRVHDMVLEYVTWLSAEENFVTILSDQHFPSEPDNIHRLSLRYRKEEDGIPHRIKKLPHVRTLVVSSRAIELMPSLSIFPVLRVLDLEQCTSSNIKGVGNLVHLRYLRLSQAYYGHYCINLPEGIGNLLLLQILDLKEARIDELPATVVHLRQLRVLVLSVYTLDMKYEKHLLQCLCDLKKLETLYIFARGSSLDFMLNVDCAPLQLRRFTACSHEADEHILRPGSIWTEFSPFSTLPRWINSSLSRLSDLSITVKILQQGDVEMLATVPILRTLDLEVIEATGERLEITRSSGHATAFRFLANLRFASRAVGVVFRPGAMQKLHKLYLCFDLAQTKDVYSNFDLGLENLTSLEIVEVEMDCRCAILWEVEAAEAALRNSTNANPNCPAAYLRRHFEKEMINDQEEEIAEELVSRKKQDALLSKIGPFGGNGGRARDIKVAPYRLESVTINFGGIVDSLEFSYSDHNGQQHHAGPWGPKGRSVDTFKLQPSEYITKVTGTIGPCYGVPKLITSLTFVTNMKSYGPYGEVIGDTFVAPDPERNNSSIVGFFVRAGTAVDAIGFYIRPL